MTEPLQHHAREKAFYAYGTAAIFARRATNLQYGRYAITYLGIVVPLLVGGAVLSFGTAFLNYVLALTGLLSCLQLALSAWSLVAKWDDRHSYAIAAMQAQTRLFNAWDALAKRPPRDMEAKVALLDADDERQEQNDLAQHISDTEKRFAMHKSLYNFGRACERCGIKPSSMTPGNCDTCGNY